MHDIEPDFSAEQNYRPARFAVAIGDSGAGTALVVSSAHARWHLSQRYSVSTLVPLWSLSTTLGAGVLQSGQTVTIAASSIVMREFAGTAG